MRTIKFAPLRKFIINKSQLSLSCMNQSHVLHITIHIEKAF